MDGILLIISNLSPFDKLRACSGSSKDSKSFSAISGPF